MLGEFQKFQQRLRRRKTDWHATIDNQQAYMAHLAWERHVDALAHALCPSEQMRTYLLSKKRLEHINNKRVLAFPVWKTYRKEARKLAQLYSALPFCQHLPSRVSLVLASILLK